MRGGRVENAGVGAFSQRHSFARGLIWQAQNGYVGCFDQLSAHRAAFALVRVNFQ